MLTQMIITKKLMRVVLLTYSLGIVNLACAQIDTISSDNKSKFTLTITSGIDFSGDQEGSFGNVSPTVNYSLSRNLFWKLHLSFGIDFSTYRTTSEPFYNSHTSWNSWGSSTNVDTFQSTRGNRIKYIGVPIKASYVGSNNKFSPIISVGVMPAISHWEVDYTHKLDDQNDVSYAESDGGRGFGLFALAEIGIGYNHNNWRFSLLASSNFLLKQAEYLKMKPYSVGLDISLSRKINASNFPHKNSTGLINSKKKRKNFLYLEALGSGLIYSINYERSLVQKDKFRFKARLGMSFFYLEDSYQNGDHLTNSLPKIDRLYSDGSRFLLPHLVPLSMGLTVGKTHQFELGFGYTFMLENFTGDGDFIFSEIGYRLETPNNYLFRVTATPIYFLYGRLLPYIGLSIGRKF